MDRFQYFTFEEVVNEEGQLLPQTVRYAAILAALIGCQGVEAYRGTALESGVEPVIVKEILYQAADSTGYGRMLPFLRAANEIMIKRGISLPLAAQPAATYEDRLEKRSTGTGGDFRWADEGSMGKWTYGSLALFPISFWFGADSIAFQTAGRFWR